MSANALVHVLYRPEDVKESEQQGAQGKPSKRKAPSAARANFMKLQNLLHVTRTLPTIQLFDAIWHVAFEWLRSVKKEAAEYLQKYYMVSVSPSNLQRQMRCGAAAWGRDLLWFAGYWAGIIGIYPGSASGTQTIESAHAQWQKSLGKSTEVAPQKVFHAMQEIFQDSWSKKFQWHTKREFPTWPCEVSAALLNGQSLRSLGRSPAIDFWNARETKLSACRNYCVVHQRTGDSKQETPDGMTTFWVMRAQKIDDVAPAEAPIDQAFAASLVQLICSEGPALEKALQACQIVTKEDGRLQLDQDRLALYFEKHAVVMKGHLPNSTWPRQRRKLETPVDALLCTCVPFVLRAECEHVLFVKALTRDPIVEKFKEIPVHRPKGRKRKFGPAPKVLPVRKDTSKPGGKKPSQTGK